MKFLSLIILLIFSSCTQININQEINSQGISNLDITINKIENENYCNLLENQDDLFDFLCREDSQSVYIEGKYGIGHMEIEKSFFKTNYIYEIKSIYPILNSLSSNVNQSYAIFNDEKIIGSGVSGNLNVILPNGEENTYTLNSLASKRNSELEFSEFNLKQISILVVVIILGLVSLFLFYKFEFKKPQTANVFLAEEQKCRDYVNNFKNQYGKEVLYSGLVNSGIDPKRAQYYVQKYY